MREETRKDNNTKEDAPIWRGSRKRRRMTRIKEETREDNNTKEDAPIPSASPPCASALDIVSHPVRQGKFVGTVIFYLLRILRCCCLPLWDSNLSLVMWRFIICVGCANVVVLFLWDDILSLVMWCFLICGVHSPSSPICVSLSFDQFYLHLAWCSPLRQHLSLIFLSVN